MCERKYTKLVSSLDPARPTRKFPTHPERYVHNFSSVVLNQFQLEALSLGPRFCHSQPKCEQINLETQFENLMSQLVDLTPSSQEMVASLKTTLVHCEQKYRETKAQDSGMLTKQHRDALKELTSNPDLVLSRPDKGAGWVLMDKRDYLNKIYSILDDGTKFMLDSVQKDCSQQEENKLIQLLKTLKSQNVISKALFDKLSPVGAQPPRLYGLPKVHKQNVPLRPIIDMSTSAFHAVAQWLVELLEPMRKSVCKHSLKNTFDFVDWVKDLNVSNKVMLSFDVESFFTNVPLLETIEFICQYLTETQADIGVPISCLKELILRCTFNMQFLFNGKYYRQRDGVAMGSPLGPVLADIFLAKLERQSLCPTITQLELYLRYMDDTFVLCDSDVNYHKLLNEFNNAHPSIRFTLEIENNNKLPFLDVLLERDELGTLRRSVYRKSTWVGQYTHFNSFVPLRYKRNLVRCLAFRANKICSSETLEGELRLIRSVLQDNGYPEPFIKKNLTYKEPSPDVITARKKSVFLSVPFKGDTPFELLTKKLKTAIEKTYFSARLIMVAETRPAISHSLKDKLPVQSQSSVLYLFTCTCGARYVGHTTRRLSRRISEHVPAALKKGTVKSVNSSILEHLWQTGHQANSDSAFKPFYFVSRRTSKALRKRILSIAESIAIRLLKPELCKQRHLVHPLLLPWP